MRRASNAVAITISLSARTLTRTTVGNKPQLVPCQQQREVYLRTLRDTGSGLQNQFPGNHPTTSDNVSGLRGGSVAGQGEGVIDSTSNLYTIGNESGEAGVVSLDDSREELRSDPSAAAPHPQTVETEDGKKEKIVAERGAVLARGGMESRDAADQFDADWLDEIATASQAPAHSNTGGSFRFPTPVQKPVGGLDWLDLCLYGDWSGCDFDALNEKLSSLRKLAEVNGEALYVAPEGDELSVAPNGMKGVAQWVLAWDGCSMAIANRAEENDAACSVFLHIGSMKLMQDGHLKAYEDCMGILKSMGFRLSRSLVSRTDLCVDLVNVDVRTFVRILMNDGAIAKASKGCLYWKGVPGVESSTGFDLGTETKIRMYNKLVEVAKNAAKKAVMILERWGCEPEAATRVEFQLRRDSLHKNWQVTTFEDLCEKLPSISHWLTHKWFRLSEEFDRKNRNHDSAVTADVWATVQDAFAAVFSGTMQVKPSLRKYVPDVEQLERQMVGVGSTILAACNETVESAEEFVIKLAARLREYAPKAMFKVGAKAAEFACRASLPVGNRTSAFDDWNAAGEGTVGGNPKKEKELSHARERAERQVERDRQHGPLLFDMMTPQVEASF